MLTIQCFQCFKQLRWLNGSDCNTDTGQTPKSTKKSPGTLTETHYHCIMLKVVWNLNQQQLELFHAEMIYETPLVQSIETS